MRQKLFFAHCVSHDHNLPQNDRSVQSNATLLKKTQVMQPAARHAQSTYKLNSNGSSANNTTTASGQHLVLQAAQTDSTTNTKTAAKQAAS
jgi:hypothetical protein